MNTNDLFAGGNMKKCISCSSPLINDVVEVGSQYPSAVYPRSKEYRDEISSSSLNLSQCSNEDCTLLQLSHSYDLDAVFEHYPYISGETATMEALLKDVATDALTKVQLETTDVVLDIGGNDGTLLKNLKGLAGHRVNIDAAVGIPNVINDPDYIKVVGKFSAGVYKKLDLRKPKLIFSTAMFYHLNDPVSFCKDIHETLETNGVWCLQMSYLGSMFEGNIYDNIVHEHVAYYSLFSLDRVLKSAGLKMFDAQVVDAYGGSIRVYITKNESTILPSEDLKRLRDDERKSNLNSVEASLRFNERLQTLKITTKNWIDHIVSEHGPMTVLGASTKGNMICQFLGLGKENVNFALDNNSKKIGSIMLGSDISIVDENQNFSNASKYILVLPYYYIDFFVKLVRKKISKGETKYLFVPLPYPYVVKVTGQ